MSEQVVKRYCLSEFAEPNTCPVGPGSYVATEDYDALHAEAEALRDQNRDLRIEADGWFSRVNGVEAELEALRAENGRLQSACDHNKTCAQVANELSDRLGAELEAARGLLREMDDYLSRRGDGEAIHTGSKFHMAIYTFLTATNARESTDHIENVLTMVDQEVQPE